MPSPKWKQAVKFIPSVSAEITGRVPAYIRLEFFFSYYALKFVLSAA